MRAAILTGACALLLAAATAGAQQTVPLPAQAPVPQPAPRERLSPPEPEPGPEPEQGEVRAPEPAPPAADMPESGAEPETAAPAEIRAEPDPACERELDRLGVRYERLEPITDSGRCAVAVPYNVSEPAPGVVLTPRSELTCKAALALARWTKNTVVPAAEALGEGVRLAEIRHASTYVCRGRRGGPDGRPSEHASGAAIDVSAFVFVDHDAIPVVPRTGQGTLVEAFQKAVRAGACLYFTTVLGPGSDDYHDDHLHLDVKDRSGAFRLCQ